MQDVVCKLGLSDFVCELVEVDAVECVSHPGQVGVQDAVVDFCPAGVCERRLES